MLELTVLLFDGSIINDGSLAVVCCIVDDMDVGSVDNDDEVDNCELRI